MRLKSTSEAANYQIGNSQRELLRDLEFGMNRAAHAFWVSMPN